MSLLRRATHSTCGIRRYLGLYAKPTLFQARARILKERSSTHRSIGSLTALAGQFLSAFIGRQVRVYWDRGHVTTVGKLLKIMPAALTCALFALAGVDINQQKVTNPVTGRKQFIKLGSDESEYFTANTQEQAERKKTNIHTREWVRLRKVIDAILWANTDVDALGKINLQFDIIDSKQNIAYALPDGHVYITKELVNSVDSDGELAFLIAHELSHAVLEHGKERDSQQQLLTYASFFAVFNIWCYFPHKLRAIRHIRNAAPLVGTSIVLLFLHMLSKGPYNRTMEVEADKLAMELITKACFDVNSGENFIVDSKRRRKGVFSSYYHLHPTYNRVQALKESHENMVKLHAKKCSDASKMKKLAKKLIEENEVEPDK